MEDEQDIDLMLHEILHGPVKIGDDPDDGEGRQAEKKRLEQADKEITKENLHDST
jgi:hypothetical protein